MDIAKHLRVVNAAPTDDLVDKRTKAIASLAKLLGKRGTAGAILGVVNELAEALDATDPGPPSSLTSEIESAIREHSSSFVAADSPLETVVCCLLAIGKLIQGGKVDPGASLSSASWYASGVLSAIDPTVTRNKPALSNLLSELSSVATDRVAASSVAARRRSKVQDITPDTLGVPSAETFRADLVKTINAPLAALRSNAILDREELDLLWWALGEWSVALDAPYRGHVPELVAIAAGIDCSVHLRRIPSPSQAHLATRPLSKEDRDRSVDGVAILKACDGQRTALLSAIGDTQEYAADLPRIFPLVAALQEPSLATTLPAHQRPTELRLWTRRSVVEATLLRAMAGSLEV